jgi:hypothetical protein
MCQTLLDEGFQHNTATQTMIMAHRYMRNWKHLFLYHEALKFCFSDGNPISSYNLNLKHKLYSSKVPRRSAFHVTTEVRFWGFILVTQLKSSKVKDNIYTELVLWSFILVTGPTVWEKKKSTKVSLWGFIVVRESQPTLDNVYLKHRMCSWKVGLSVPSCLGCEVLFYRQLPMID